MKLREIKKWINKLADSTLEQELLYMSEEIYASGVVSKIEKAKANLYYTGEDDPATLYTFKQLKEQGMDKEEIKECDIEIPKGSYYIKF